VGSADPTEAAASGRIERIELEKAMSHQTEETIENAAAAETPAAAPSTVCGMGVETAATVGVVAVGAVLFEAALIPGMLLGAAAMVAPKVFPRLGDAEQPGAVGGQCAADAV
jgi:hypothetical protein